MGQEALSPRSVLLLGELSKRGCSHAAKSVLDDPTCSFLPAETGNFSTKSQSTVQSTASLVTLYQVPVGGQMCDRTVGLEAMCFETVSIFH